jgi:hypothetical protein
LYKQLLGVGEMYEQIWWLRAQNRVGLAQLG